MDSLVVLSQSTGSDGAAAAAGLGFGLLFLLFWLVLFGLSIAAFVLWIISLIHVLSHNDIKDRTMWILIILLVGSIGGVIYFFTVRKEYDRGGARDPQAGQPSA